MCALLCMHTHTYTCMLVLREAREGVRFPGPGVTGWEQDLGLMQEQNIPLTAEPSLLPLY